ncbi:MAG: hypothetical protein HY823_05830 [Acidobacteria bacterium]|nr:hypothetical protein [Acidobacteriota bacterium]
MSSLRVEVWLDEHGTRWELVQLGLDEVGGGCLVREGPSHAQILDGDLREGFHVVARFGDLEGARSFLQAEGFHPA